MQAILPGNVGESALVDRIFSDDPETIMPPPSTKKVLSEAQKEILKQWIAEGAKYEPHWSFIAPLRPPLPPVRQADWVRNPIDTFVLARLESVGLSPAPEADRRTLARRLSLDLIGLPPSPELVEEFANDESSDAYENLVDRLLASAHWGEHRGRYWLDLARYADTHGMHFDNYREMWLYRDEVISAFNRNQPFDQFTIEQLAGDLLENCSQEQQIASGFNRCNMTTNEGGAIPAEYQVLYTRDRTETVSQVWLGLTAGCAVCHDHKFDPLSQRDFYEMAAFFNNTTQQALDDNIRDTPPVVRIFSEPDKSRYPALTRELAETRAQAEERKHSGRGDFNAWLAEGDSTKISELISSDALMLYAPLTLGASATLDFTINNEAFVVAANNTAWEDGLGGNKALRITPETSVELPDIGNFEHNQSFSLSTWIKFTESGQTGAILARMENGPRFRGWDFWVQNNRVGMHLIGNWPTNALKVVANSPVKANEWHHVLVTYSGSGISTGIHIFYDGIEQASTPEGLAVSDTTRSDVPLKLAQRNSSDRINNVVLQDLRLYSKALKSNEIQSLAKQLRLAEIVAKPGSKRTASEVDELFQWWLISLDATTKQLKERESGLVSEEKKILGRSTVTHVMQERTEPAMAYVLERGNYEKPKDRVNPNTPDFLPPFPTNYPKNRLGFAQWLALPENPLTARVTVNRFWQELFGTGLVLTSGDFGISGELPVNQELLDWLAVEFREGGWNVKKMYKLIVTSATYRQTSVTPAEKLEKDPHNRLCSRGPRFRMDAEMIRDYALAASGLLVDKIGGPSVKPYQPEGVWEAVAMKESNTHTYHQDSGENLYRRSMYTLWKRAAPPASMEVFNAPTREVCTVRRERTNTPLQALVTMNDPQLMEAARRLAENVLKISKEDDARLNAIAQRLLARAFRQNELKIVKSSLIDLRSYYETHKDDALKLISVGESQPDPTLAPETLATWTMLTNELLNLDDVLKK